MKIKTFDQTRELAKEVLEISKRKYDDNQLVTQIHPVISNYVYHNSEELKQEIAQNTAFQLANILDKDNFDKCMTALAIKISF